MASRLEADLASRIERASRQVVWQTPFAKHAAVGGLFEALGDYSQPAGITFHGIGLARARAGLIVEVYCECQPSEFLRARQTVSRLMEIPPAALSIVPCWGFSPQIGHGDAAGHMSLAQLGSHGTFGGLAGDLQSNLLFGVSNNHVFANSNKGKIGDVLVDVNGDQFGELHRYQPLAGIPAINDVDGAVGRIFTSTTLENQVYPSGMRSAARGLRVQKLGAASGYTSGRILATQATASIPYPGLGNINFHRCLRIVGDHGPFSVPGDSGSLVLDDRFAVVGIIFAGDEVGGFSLANPVDALASRLNIAF
jgi:hypothetical protein